MNKWIVEDWRFTVTATAGESQNCRLGIERGDTFTFEYGTPADFCPRAMAEIFTWCEVIRCGGDFTYRGCTDKYEMELPCPCGSVTFRLSAEPINRDDNGVYIGESDRY